MQHIADAAGLTKAALYYHFRDKEDLFGEMMLAEMIWLQGGITGVVKDDHPFADQLAAIGRLVFSHFHDDFGRLMQEFHTHISIDRHAALVCRVPLPHEVLRPIFERAAATGEMRSDIHPDLAVSLYFSMVLGQLKGPAGEMLSLSPEIDIAETIAEVMVHGIGSRSPRMAKASSVTSGQP
jgi:AcrR family transcriptional regulator